MFKNKRLYSGIILLLIIWLGCKKNYSISYSPPQTGLGWFLGQAPNPIDYSEGILLPSYVFDYMKFEQGSYWIYKEQNSGDIDSVWVIPSLNHDTIYNCQGKKYQYIETIVKSSHFKCKYCYSCWSISNYVGNNCLEGGGYIIRINRSKLDSFNNFLTPNKANLTVGTEILVFPIHKKSYRLQYYYGKSGNDSIQTINYLSCLTANKLLFKDVLISHDSHNPFENESMQFTFARKVGLIAQKFSESNRNWQLIRYKVIQNGKIEKN